MPGKRPRRSVTDRARRRAIRALADRLGVAYSVAARLLPQPLREVSAGVPTEFPVGEDTHRAWLFAMREQRGYGLRLRDTRLAADLPLGRAAHLAERFPPLRRLRPGFGALYDGEGRQAAIAMLYAVLALETAALLPGRQELDWVAGLGEQTAVDLICAPADRAARLLLDDHPWRLFTRIEAALAALAHPDDADVLAALAHPGASDDGASDDGASDDGASDDSDAVSALADPAASRDAARALTAEFRTLHPRRCLTGARHILDALLVAAHPGHHPPGAEIRLLAGPWEGRLAVVVGARWTQTDGPPTHYEARVEAAEAVVTVGAGDAVAPEPDSESEAVSA